MVFLYSDFILILPPLGVYPHPWADHPHEG